MSSRGLVSSLLTLAAAAGCGWTIPACSPTTTCTASQCGAEPAVEIDCNGIVVKPVCEATGTNQCGWVSPPCVPVHEDAGGPCTKGSVTASDYDQACTTDADCTPVFQGSMCGPCACTNAAINKSALPAYNAGVTAAGGPLVNTCLCPGLPSGVCSAGVCTLP
jgi:hypothetical protein